MQLEVTRCLKAFFQNAVGQCLYSGPRGDEVASKSPIRLRRPPPQVGVDAARVGGEACSLKETATIVTQVEPLLPKVGARAAPSTRHRTGVSANRFAGAPTIIQTFSMFLLRQGG